MTYDDYTGTFEGYMIARMAKEETEKATPAKVEWTDSSYESWMLSEYDRGIR